jgi:hypothetical protein
MKWAKLTTFFQYGRKPFLLVTPTPTPTIDHRLLESAAVTILELNTGSIFTGKKASILNQVGDDFEFYPIYLLC